MYKVICINDKWTNGSRMQNPPRPNFGEVCIVIDTNTNFSVPQYVLEGYPKNLCYASNYFAALDGPDETETARYKELEEASVARMDALFAGLTQGMPEPVMEEEAFARTMRRIDKNVWP